MEDDPGPNQNINNVRNQAWRGQNRRQPENWRQANDQGRQNLPRHNNLQRENQNRGQPNRLQRNVQNMNVHLGQRGQRPPLRGMHRNGAHGAVQNLDGIANENRIPDLRQNNHRGNRDPGQLNRDPGQLNRNNRFMGFKALEDLALSEPLDIIAKVNEKKEAFLNLITKPVEPDMHILIIQILSKSCLSSFEDLKTRLLLEICNSEYLMYLKNYIMELPYAEQKKNKYYWNNQNDFWKNLIFFCETLVIKLPSVAKQKCRSLIEITSKIALEELNKRYEFVLAAENSTKLDEIRERILIEEKKIEDKKQSSRLISEYETCEPPEDFRQLSVIPKQEELLEERPYLRANVVRGGYRDVEHYLDIQFRLLREDCFGPLREGLLQYIKEPNKKKFDNMRVYRNVKFIGPYISKSKSGVLLQLDENTQKMQKKINWAHSKRFIFGSLLLFSKDGCQTFISATILDRDIKYLSQGVIPVSIVENANSLREENILQTNDSYVMFESEVYFEPYYHVLKALQNPSFAEHIAMSKYIVNVDPTPRPPQYLQYDTVFEVEMFESLDARFEVLQPHTWPSHKELALNESQFEAYKLALTHEFAVIQGPPGTGKTHLGVKVARTLLENLKSNENRRKCIMLIICYTNHALDQFLENILKITNSIVRIGGQSRNEAMEKISLNNLRKASTKQHFHANSLYHSERRNLNIMKGKLSTAQTQIESLSNGILTYDCMCEYVPQLDNYLRNYNSRSGEDKLLAWLLENANFQVNLNINEILKDYEEHIETIEDTDDRTSLELDDISEEIHEIDVNGIQVRTVFMLNEARHKIKLLAKHYKKTSNLREKNILVEEIRHLHYIRCIFEEMRHRYRERGESRPVRQRENLIQLQNFDRWCIYFTWANTAINVLREQIAPLQEDLNNAAATYEEARMNLDLQVLQNIKVVGMTTSGAARLRKLLTALAPPIVIVEEAAEVLEQHIVTSLTKHCKHLILIGDHQQLRPSAAYMKLARHYDIEVSLFERMIMNDMHSRRLGVQHRMRPEIAALISPHIYPSLENHLSVEAFPRVRGITSNVFFYTHDYKEDAIDDNASRTNAKEADMTLGLANYLMQQGYEAQDVTILAAYSGQMFYMRKQRPKYAFLDKIKITVVDNYQGEESKIILLSLVRNNTENKIGFLGTENRICVALSRAKEGFYIFGNIEILKRNSKLWTKIAKTLEDGGNIGNSFRLKCENHPDMISNISSLKDFEKVPEGGCQLLCNFKLSACGHPCPLICHGYDRGHSNLKCYLNCEREICELKHACPLKCFVKCEPCAKMVMKTLPCGHEMKVPCHRQPSDPAVKCLTIVAVTLPNCGHEAKKQCHLDMKYVACPVPCGARVERCGHTCRRRCHVIDDPDHEKYICEKACANAKRGCTANLVGDRGMHQCTKLCHETCDLCDVVVVKKRSNCKHSVRIECYKDADETECRKQCARMLSCGHFCKKKCFEPCGDCNEKVKKVIPECGHTVEVLCKITPKREMCQEKCSRQLSCRHICARRCNEPCSAAHCTQLMPDRFTSPCGHAVQLPCNVLHWRLSGEELKQKLLEWCQAACTATLKCTHACAGTCSGCQNGRLHAPCTHQCQATNICGHQCEEPCNEVCPPCRKQCEVKCPHSKCSKQCGAPCVPCQEKCTRQCRHGKCQRRCGEPCSRPPCDQPCDKNLSCGHRCRGLCGEPCPPICNLCSPDTFPRDFLGDEFEEDAKFIQLQDCNHILEVEDADNLMNGDKETITIRSCPFCRKPIINTYRYKDCVNEMYRAEINPIKALVYGTQEQVKEKRLELVHTCAKFKDMHAKAIQENEHFKKAFLKLQAVVKTENKISLLQLKMHFLYIEILDMIGEKYEAYKKVTDTEFENLFLKQIRIICAVLIANIKKISQQQQGDISNEIKRMGSMIQLSEIFSHSAYKMNKSHPKVIEATKSAKNAVFSNHMYKEVVVLTALKKLQEEIKVSGIVTKEERDLIVKAIGFKQGHWFKCPNGHFYCIGECGGAMEISKCIECGAQIGGQSHALLGDNLHAPEMDGSRFAAWSQEYNNMANFDLNGL